MMKGDSNFVQIENLPNLLCAQCKRVLSQFPIYCYSGGSSCGRCPYPENGIRNEAYESLSQNLRFPCSHNENGCLEYILPKDVAEHEKFCNFRKYNCPIVPTADIPTCGWKGFSKDLLDHFELKHPTFLLDNYTFEVDFVNSHNENYLLPYGERLYLLNRRSDSKKCHFFCTVSSIGTEPDYGENTYKIILESGNKSGSYEVCNKVNATTLVIRDVVNNILNNPVSIIARISIFKEEIAEDSDEDEPDEDEPNENINFELLQELECLVCMEYMVPPIHQCVTGHSICFTCKESIKECPTCRNEFKNTQNFALAQIIQHIDYPCKHDKCKFFAKAKEIKKHEATCIYSPYQCPLNELLACDEKMQFDDIYDHIVKLHYENLLEYDVVSIPFRLDGDQPLDDFIEDCLILRYATKLFKLHFKYRDEEFSFATQLIGPANESSNYRFEIDVLDSLGKKYRAYMTSPCGPMTDSAAAFDDDKFVVMFILQQIRRLIGDQLCFRIMVSKL